jgi:flagellar biosynthesis protein FlhG
MPLQTPFDQAHGLRTLFAHARVRFVPVVSNPHVPFAGMLLERLCTAFAEQGATSLVIDAAEGANEPSEMALLDLAACIEPLSTHVSYVAARGLPLKFVDATGSTRAFAPAAREAAPASRVVIVHASAAELCRMFGRQPRDAEEGAACPLLLAADHPASVTHAYAAMKLLARRAGLLVHELLLGAADDSPRAERIAMQIAICADDFLGAVLRDWVRIDPACDPTDAPSPALRRLVREQLRAALGADALPAMPAVPAALLPARESATSRARH